MAIDWAAARTEFLKLRKDVDDTEAGMRLFRALGGKTLDEIQLARVRESDQGRKILLERSALIDTLTRREQLRVLPAGTLGREYLDFVEREKIYPDVLHNMMSKIEADVGDVDLATMRARGHAIHDLLHLTTGYGRDAAGEIALLAFTAVQDRTRQLDWLSRLGCAMAILQGRIDVLRLRRHALRRARQTPWMFVQDWLSFLSRPIKEVREELGLLPLPEYRTWTYGRAKTAA